MKDMIRCTKGGRCCLKIVQDENTQVSESLILSLENVFMCYVIK